jgi:argininosuccinate lyase
MITKKSSNCHPASLLAHTCPERIPIYFRVHFLGYRSWLGRRDSNPRIAGPEPAALPLGYAPIYGKEYPVPSKRARNCHATDDILTFLRMSEYTISQLF